MALIDTNLDWLLISDKLSRWAALSSTSITAGDMPLSYLISSQQPTDRCRFIDLTSPIVFTVDLTDAKAAQDVTTIRCLALLYNNSSNTGTFTITGNLGYSKVAKSLWPSNDSKDYLRIHSYIYEPNGIPDNIFTITINDITPRKPARNAAGYETASWFEIGNLIVDYGISSNLATAIRQQGTVIEGQDEEQKITISEGGATFPRIRPQSNRKSFTLRFKTEAAYRAGMAKLRRDVGISQAICLIEDVGDVNGNGFQMQKITYGLFESLQDVSLIDNRNFEVVVKLREML
jgi:hypothetical protein